MWVGRRYYTPQSFTQECIEMGPSKRVPWPLPRWFELGKTWVFLAHEDAAQEPCEACGDGGRQVKQTVGELSLEVTVTQTCETCGGRGVVPAPAVFYVFKPVRVVRIIPDTMPEEEREALRRQGLTLVEVPANDPDHSGCITAGGAGEDTT
jgi:hypothetical protein